MKTQITTGIVSTPTSATLAAVADYRRRKAEREAAHTAAAEAKHWQRPNKPFGQLAGFADALKKQRDEALHEAFSGRKRNGKFVSRAGRNEAAQVAEKLSALGFGSK